MLQQVSEEQEYIPNVSQPHTYVAFSADEVGDLEAIMDEYVPDEGGAELQIVEENQLFLVYVGPFVEV